MALGDREDVAAHPLLALRRARDGEDLVEVPPEGLRLELGDERHGVDLPGSRFTGGGPGIVPPRVFVKIVPSELEAGGG
jgi:hypothetical protein